MGKQEGWARGRRSANRAGTYGSGRQAHVIVAVQMQELGWGLVRLDRKRAGNEKGPDCSGPFMFGGESGTRTPDLRIMIPWNLEFLCVDRVSSFYLTI